MGTAFGLARHAILAHQDEDGEDDAFRGDDQSEDAEGEGVEGSYAGDHVEVDGGPGEHEKELQQEKSYAADEFCDGFADALGDGAAFERVLFEFGDGFDVVLRGIFFGVVG